MAHRATTEKSSPLLHTQRKKTNSSRGRKNKDPQKKRGKGKRDSTNMLLLKHGREKRTGEKLIEERTLVHLLTKGQPRNCWGFAGGKRTLKRDMMLQGR